MYNSWSSKFRQLPPIGESDIWDYAGYSNGFAPNALERVLKDPDCPRWIKDGEFEIVQRRRPESSFYSEYKENEYGDSLINGKRDLQRMLNKIDKGRRFWETDNRYQYFPVIVRSYPRNRQYSDPVNENEMRKMMRDSSCYEMKDLRNENMLKSLLSASGSYRRRRGYKKPRAFGNIRSSRQTNILRNLEKKYGKRKAERILPLILWKKRHGML